MRQKNSIDDPNSKIDHLSGPIISGIKEIAIRQLKAQALRQLVLGTNTQLRVPTQLSKNFLCSAHHFTKCGRMLEQGINSGFAIWEIAEYGAKWKSDEILLKTIALNPVKDVCFKKQSRILAGGSIIKQLGKPTVPVVIYKLLLFQV